MHAAWYEQQGPADQVLKIGELECPEPSAHEVAVRIHYSGINPSDTKRRNGTRTKIQDPKIIPHSDGAGIIEKVGSQVSKDRIGQRVWTYNAQWQRPFGTAAEYVVLPEALAVPLPEQAPFTLGACLGIPAMTAHYAVFADGAVNGQTILVTGGAGSVGHFAIQFAKWGGAKVITTISSTEKAQIAKASGADEIINYREENVIDRIKALTNNAGIDRIVEVDFGGNLEISQAILKLNGTIATYASMGNTHPALPFYSLMFRGITIRLVNVYDLTPTARQHALKDITTMLEAKLLKELIAAEFPLEKIIAAHQLVESNKHIGQVLLKVKN